MTDIAPGLLENLQKSFENNLAADKKAAALLEKIDAGNGNYVTAGDYAERVGESLAKSFQTNLGGDVLPDGKMYYNIAEKTIRPLFEEEYGMVSKVAATVQKSLNTKAGIGLNAVRAAYDSDAVKGIVNKVCSYDQYDDAAWVLNDAAVSFSRSVVDRTLKANIDFQGKSGRSPKIVRRAGYNCCQWCADLEGTYEYPNTPEDVFRRHDNCRCDVEYDPGTGKVQNVHTKGWRKADERDKIKKRKNIGLKNDVDKEKLKNAPNQAINGKYPGEPMSVQKALSGANPNFSKGKEYQDNCQRCVQAYEMRRRGYDVEALPISGKWDTVVYGNECFVDSKGNKPKFTSPKTAEQVQKEIESAPIGSRYIVYIQWDEYDAHVFSAERQKGIVQYVDPQTGDIDVSSYFSQGIDGKFRILRVDDKQISTDKSILKATVK